MYSGYGKWIIESLGELPRHAGHVILIRHSERPDFRNIPANIWNNVILTQIGEEVATEFGVALATEAHIPSISAHGWGLERCVITAKKIVEGATSAGISAVYSPLTNFQSPIKNIDLYSNYLQSGKYFEMVEDWFSSNSVRGPFIPYDMYSRHIVSKLINEHMWLTDNVTVIVTHDLHILPLFNYVFGEKKEIGFMDGIMISKGDNMLKFFSNNYIKSFSCNDFYSK